MAEIPHAFVTGHPVNHSRSPIIHGFWLEKYGLTGSYSPKPCEPDEIKNFITHLNQSKFVGGNVTLPYKETVVSMMDRLQPTAKRLGAVNTIWLEDGLLVGDNTDGYGFLANLDQRAEGWDSRERKIRGALILGAGGASRAIIDGLIQREFQTIIIANRTLKRAELLAQKFGPSCFATEINNLPQQAEELSLVVNTTSVGMEDGQSPIDLSGFSDSTLVTDIVYSPLHTPLLRQAEQLNMQWVDGLGMLLHQAVPGFNRWFGVRPQVTDELRNRVLKDLGEGS